MAMRSRPTMLKRQRERERIEKQKQKTAKRLERGHRPSERADAGGEDPDIAHIVPGPQPLADWQIDEAEAAAKEAKDAKEKEEKEAAEASGQKTE